MAFCGHVRATPAWRRTFARQSVPEQGRELGRRWRHYRGNSGTVERLSTEDFGHNMDYQAFVKEARKHCKRTGRTYKNGACHGAKDMKKGAAARKAQDAKEARRQQKMDAELSEWPGSSQSAKLASRGEFENKIEGFVTAYRVVVPSKELAVKMEQLTQRAGVAEAEFKRGKLKISDADRVWLGPALALTWPVDKRLSDLLQKLRGVHMDMYPKDGAPGLEEWRTKKEQLRDEVDKLISMKSKLSMKDTDETWLGLGKTPLLSSLLGR